MKKKSALTRAYGGQKWGGGHPTHSPHSHDSIGLHTDQIHRHLELLFEWCDEGAIEVRQFVTEEQTLQKFYDVKDLTLAVIDWAGKEDVCVGVHPRFPVNGKLEGTKEAVRVCRYLFADFDSPDKTFTPSSEDLEELLRALEMLKLPPRFVVNSGHGFHVYFKLTRNITREEFEMLEKRLLAALQYVQLSHLNLDEGVKDLARVLRLAGTYNVKTQSTLVRIVYEAEAEIEPERLLYFEFETMPHTTPADTLIKATKEIWRVGQRQYATLFLAGALAKAGVSKEEALKIYHEHFKPIDDPDDYKTRILAIERTYERHEQGLPIMGVMGLKNLGARIEMKNTEPISTPTSVQKRIERIEDGEEISLEFISAKALLEKNIAPPQFVVEGLIPAGLIVLAGKPKTGKSWFVLWLAVQVARGGTVWGYEVKKKGTVYYFALEDSEWRVAKRLEKLLPEEEEELEGLRFYTKTFWLDEKGLRTLEKLEDPVLVIIDTYGRAKAMLKKTRNQTEYDFETEILGKLQKWAVDKGVSVIAVHHTRKAGAEDVFETVLGSTAITAVADAVIVMERLPQRGRVRFHITGRDIEEKSLGEGVVVNFDVNEGVFFEYVGTYEEIELSELQKEVLNLCETPRTLNEISDLLGKRRGTVCKILKKLTSEGLVVMEKNKKGITLFYRRTPNAQ